MQWLHKIFVPTEIKLIECRKDNRQLAKMIIVPVYVDDNEICSFLNPCQDRLQWLVFNQFLFCILINNQWDLKCCTQESLQVVFTELHCVFWNMYINTCDNRYYGWLALLNKIYWCLASGTLLFFSLWLELG